MSPNHYSMPEPTHGATGWEPSANPKHVRLVLEINLEVTDATEMAAATMDFEADVDGNVVGMAEPSDVGMAFGVEFSRWLQSTEMPGFKATAAPNGFHRRQLNEAGNWSSHYLWSQPGPGRDFGSSAIFEDPEIVADWGDH